jgi:hypothetical protein
MTDNRTLLEDAYRGNTIWIGYDSGRLIATAKGQQANLRAVFHRYGVDVEGTAPQPIISRINECVGKFRHMPGIPLEAY